MTKRSRRIGRRELSLLLAAVLAAPPWCVAQSQENRADLADRAAPLREFLLRLLALPNSSARSAEARRTEATARARYRSTPDDVANLLVLISALGVVARSTPPLDPAAANLVVESRELIANARRLGAGLAWAPASEALWNLGVLRRGGPIAAQMFGASERRALAAIDEAITLDGRDSVMCLAFAAALASVDPARYGVRIRALLEVAGDAEAPAIVRDIARRLGEELTRGTQAARAYAMEIL